MTIIHFDLKDPRFLPELLDGTSGRNYIIGTAIMAIYYS